MLENTWEVAKSDLWRDEWGWGSKFPTWAGKWGGMLSPGCQEKQDTL